MEEKYKRKKFAGNMNDNIVGGKDHYVRRLLNLYVSVGQKPLLINWRQDFYDTASIQSRYSAINSI